LKLASLGDDSLDAERRLEALQSFKVPKAPEYALVGTIDAITAHRRDVTSPARRRRREAEGARRQGAHHARRAVRSALARDPRSRPADRVVGVRSRRERHRLGVVGGRDKKLEAAVAETETYVRTQLGDARSFSLDSPKSRAPRIASLRQLAA